MKQALFGAFTLLLFLPQISDAALTVACTSTLCGSAVQPSTTAPTKIYYSNIGAGYVSAGGGACDTNINPKCKTMADQLQLTFTSNNTSITSATNVYLFVNTTTVTADPAASVSLTGAGKITSTTYAAPTLTSTFENICDVSFANAADDCLTDGQIRIHIVADINNDGLYTSGTDEIYSISLFLLSSIDEFSSSGGATGLYSFLAYPGDEKIKLKTVRVETAFPNLDTTNNAISGVRVYYTASTLTNMSADLDAMTATGTSYIDIPISGTDLSTYFVKPLSNLSGQNVYCFLTTLVDAAGNIGFKMAVADRSEGTNGFGDGMCAQPSQVAGLISESGNCFIATAAFGSPLDSHVQTLRNFRDTYLLKTTWGKNFVSWYYKNSPLYADKISKNENAKQIARFFLWPAVGYSTLSLKWGVMNATLFTFTLLLLPFLIIQYKVLKRRRKT